MATVFWKGKQWIAQWYLADGSRVKRGTGIGKGKRRDAERSAAEMEAKDRKEQTNDGRKYEEIISRASADAKAGRMNAERAEEYITEIRKVSDPNFKILSLNQHLTEWTAEKSRRVESKTAETFKDMLRHFKATMGASVMAAPVEALTRKQIENALLKLKEQGYRGSTINLDLRALRQALGQAVEDGLIARNAAKGIPAISEDDTVQRAPFTAEEVRRMIDHPSTPDEWHGMILIGAHTGLRMSDIFNLSRDHIDGTELVILPAKTKRSKRVIRIPLTPPVISWIGDRQGGFFPDISLKPKPTISSQFSAIMGRAGVPASVILPGNIKASRSFHSLRHTFATWLAEADVHADVRQKLTGHSKAETHARYSHHDESLARAVKTLPDIGPAKKAE